MLEPARSRSGFSARFVVHPLAASVCGAVAAVAVPRLRATGRDGPGSRPCQAGRVGPSRRGRGVPRFAGAAWLQPGGGSEHHLLARRYRRFPGRFPRARLSRAWCSPSLLPQRFLAGKSPFALFVSPGDPLLSSPRISAGPAGSVPAGRSIPGRRALRYPAGGQRRRLCGRAGASPVQPGTGGAASPGAQSGQ